MKCDEGEPGIITWKPDENTPDTVYYHCFTHRYLGWKINVVDSCDLQTQASNREEIYIDAEAEPSIQHETKLFPSENFLQQHEKDLIKHHNMNGGSPKTSADLTKNEDFNKFITEGIKAAEALEETILREKQVNITKSQSTLTGEKEHREDERDLLAAIAKIPQVDMKQTHRLPPKRTQYSPSGLPVFLRPPQNVHFPLYNSKHLPRIPIAMERRPVHRRPVGPPLLPQQSIMINHYRKPSFGQPPIGVRNFMKPKMPSKPLKHMTPVLLLGEPTEIKSQYKKTSDVVIGKPSKTQINVSPVFLVKNHREPSHSSRPNIKNNENIPARSSFKDPFDIKTESIPIREHSNTGFKAETIIVESGFRPIRREDSLVQENFSDENEPKPLNFGRQSISRRSDDFDDEYDSESKHEEPRSSFFEPMFIPSPMDSVALPLVNKSDHELDYMVSEASNREDIFYLPPNESKRSVVSYDAKAILDTSLLNDPLPSKNDFVKLSSKTKQFIKDTPQFAPFKGEIPSDLKIQISANRAQSSVLTKDKPASISTKLSAVKTNNGTR